MRARYRIAKWHRNAFVRRVCSWRWWILLIGLGWAPGLAAAGSRQVLLVGPQRADPAWVFFQIGLRASLGDWGETDAVELRDLSPRRPGANVTGADLETATTAACQALVLLPPAGKEAAWHAYARWAAHSGIAVYWIGEDPPDLKLAGHWQIAWEEWARSLQIVATALGPADGGRVVYDGLSETLPPMAWNALHESDAWPLTGRWEIEESWDGSGRAGVVISSRHATVGRLARERSANTVVVTWIDGFVLENLGGRNAVRAAVVPHYFEAGGQVADSLLGSDPPSPGGSQAVRPLVVTKENGAVWREIWRRWEY